MQTTISFFAARNIHWRVGYFGENNDPALFINNHARRLTAIIPLNCAYKYNEPVAREQDEMDGIFSVLRAHEPEIRVNEWLTMQTLEAMAQGDFQFDIALSLFKMAIALEIQTDNTTLHKLREYIADRLDYLIHAKPYVAEAKPVIGEYDLTIDGEKVKSGELTERVTANGANT
jgi:hypothetical protein